MLTELVISVDRGPTKSLSGRGHRNSDDRVSWNADMWAPRHMSRRSASARCHTAMSICWLSVKEVFIVSIVFG